MSSKAAVSLWNYVDRRQSFVLHDNLRCVQSGACLLLVHGLITQGKLETVVGGLESRILQGALEAGGVAAQQVKSIRAVDCHSRCHVAVAVDIEPDFDAAEFGRIEPDLEAVLAGNRFAGDFDGDAGKWNGRRLRPGLRNQSCGGSGVLRRMRGCAGDG